MTQDKDNTPNPPADVVRDTNLKASIWRNEGEKGVFYATTFARTYKDQDGQYHDTDSFVAGDLLKLSELAREAYARTNAMRQKDREAERAAFHAERETGKARRSEHRR